MYKTLWICGCVFNLKKINKNKAFMWVFYSGKYGQPEVKRQFLKTFNVYRSKCETQIAK